MRILDTDPRRLEVRHNGEWLDMPMVDLLGLVRTTTAAQLLEREDFAKRFAAQEPISLLELLYPLLQGYDSVAIDADIELGGTDQKFNLLLGRDIQRHYGKPEQAIMTMPILVGTDGTRKMSKSLGNQIGVTDPPEEMYGKTMAIPDEAMGEYYRLLLGRELRRPSSRRATPSACWPASSSPGCTAPAAGRGRRGRTSTGSSSATTPRRRSRRRASPRRTAPVHLPELIAGEFGVSRSEARRLIDQGGVWLDDEQLAPGEHDVPAERLEGARPAGSAGAGSGGFAASRRAGARSRAILPGRPAGAPGRWAGRSSPEGSPFGEVRRSLKTQQHAHLRSVRIVVCVQVRPVGGSALRAFERR